MIKKKVVIVFFIPGQGHALHGMSTPILGSP